MTQLLPTLTDEEIAFWKSSVQAGSDAEEGFGALKTARGCLPLQALDVQARIDGLLARTEVTQTFVNGYDEPLEATYIFPLPDRAAVTRFRLEVAGRVVEGNLKERGAARQEYARAVKAGHRAALTEEDRPGVFTMKVGNLPPREKATVRLTLTGPLPFSDGEATYRFPLVIAPRYIPGDPFPGLPVGDGVASDTDAVPDASRISPPVLLPGFPNPVRLSLSVAFSSSALPPTSLRSSLHAVVEEQASRTRVVRLQPGERLNRDFLLRFRLAERQIVTSLSLQPDEDGKEGTFALTLVPPASDFGASRPRDVVFVLDRSGSMAGWKVVAARRAVARMIDTLTDRDRFAVLAFDDHIETPPGLSGSQLVAATDRHRFRAVEFLAQIGERGGTEMAQPLEQAVKELSRDAGNAQRDRVLVLITDGQVGNEDQILRHLGAGLRGIRVFTLGIDRAVNAAFLTRLAELGGGGSEIVESEDRLDEVMDQVHRQIGTPVLTGLRLEPAGLAVTPGSLVPERLPDLFTGTPVVVLGRYRGAPEGTMVLSGRDSRGQEWGVKLAGYRDDSKAPATVWARGKLRAMEDRYAIGQGDLARLEKEIVTLSLRFGVMCRFTAFVAVDRAEVVNPGGKTHMIVQPVEMPDGWGMRMNPSEIVTCLSCELEAFSVPTNLRAPAPLPDSVAAIDLGPEFEMSLESSSSLEAERDIFETDLDVPTLNSDDSGSEVVSLDEDNDLESSDFDLSDEEPADSGSQVVDLDESFDDYDDVDFLDEDEEAEPVPAKPRPQAATVPALSEPEDVFRRHVHDLHHSMQTNTATSPTACVAWLRWLQPAMQDLLEELPDGSERDPATQRLADVLLEVQKLLAVPRPTDAAIQEVWAKLAAALQSFLTAWSTPGAFWK
jgi:Ca-activated chloride channel family protein